MIKCTHLLRKKAFCDLVWVDIRIHISCREDFHPCKHDIYSYTACINTTLHLTYSFALWENILLPYTKETVSFPWVRGGIARLKPTNLWWDLCGAWWHTAMKSCSSCNVAATAALATAVFMTSEIDQIVRVVLAMCVTTAVSVKIFYRLSSINKQVLNEYKRPLKALLLDKEYYNRTFIKTNVFIHSGINLHQVLTRLIQ